MKSVDVETPHGPARAHLDLREDGPGTLVMGHGAGGGVDAPDIAAVAEVAAAAGYGVALVEQPYRVAGRKAPAPANQLDTAWLAVVEALRDRLGGGRLIAGGRSSGARVACRTAADAGADAVLCLAFPVHPPGKPEKSRLDELDAVRVPVLVVQGESDPFGMPPDAKGRTVARVPGNHGLKKDIPAVGAAARDWLGELD